MPSEMSDNEEISLLAFFTAAGLAITATSVNLADIARNCIFNKNSETTLAPEPKKRERHQPVIQSAQNQNKEYDFTLAGAMPPRFGPSPHAFQSDEKPSLLKIGIVGGATAGTVAASCSI